jgi:surface antigen
MRRIGSILAAVLTAAALVVIAPPAANSSVLLCSGVSNKDVAKCDPGWAANMHLMHWRMYSGHNCTNYVAYRLKRDGVPMPSYRLGNADTWAPNARRHGVLVDSRPTVGSVGAWPGRRHIVYVDEVGSNYLIISEDNWPGYYPKGMYRKLKVFKGERGYPTQFIHFKGGTGGTGTINGPLPTIEGTPEVGSTLTAAAGTWTPSGVTLKYQWLRDGAIISGATSRTYRITTDDVGHELTVSVTGSKSGFASRTASSEPVGPIDGGQMTAGTPTISGPPQVGGTLTADPGTWEPDGATFQYQWLANGSMIRGATSTTYSPTKDVLGKRISVRVTGRATGLEPVTVESAETGSVTGKGETPRVINGSTPVVSGEVRRGRSLTADPGAWGPDGVELTFEWLRGDGVVVATDTTRYKIRTADLGQTLAFRVTGTKDSYGTLTKTSEPTAAVRATPTLLITPEPGQGSAVLGVVVSVSNAPTPTGLVRVHEGSKRLLTNDLAIGRPGRATLRLRDLARGTHTLTVSYSGSSTVAPGSETVTVKVF